MVAPTVEQVLRAGRWEDLGLPRTKEALRVARTAVHPDVNSEPGASDAFARLDGLFAAPEFHVRVATGSRAGNSTIEWLPRPGFEDLTDVAEAASGVLGRVKHPRFFTRAWRNRSGILTEYGATGERWWFLRDFSDLDGRTVVWIAKRLAAALAQADKAGWVHGDVNPDTVAILPAEHGLKLDGWWYGIKEGERLTVRPTAPHTPPRYLSGYPADSKLSVAQGAGMLRGMLRAGEPAALTEVLARHVLKPEEPSRFFAQVDRVAADLYGKPAWHPLDEPTVGPI